MYSVLQILINSETCRRNDTETLSALLALCEENPTVTIGFPLQRPGMQRSNVSFLLSVDKLLNKLSVGGNLDSMTLTWRQASDKSYSKITIGT